MHSNSILIHAQVVSTDPSRGCVYVMTASGQIPTGYPVRVLHHGHADAVRVKQHPLPAKGTDGLVAILYGDTRNAVWLGSLYLAGMDARTHPTDPDAEYTADHGGGYSLLDGSGQFTRTFPDGTNLSVTALGIPLTPTRHVVGANQTRQAVPYTAAERVLAPPDPFTVTIRTASGVTISIPPSGGINIDLPGGKTFDLTQGGAAASDALVLVSKFLSAFNAHEHRTGSTGGPTSPPLVQLAVPDVQSAIAKVSA